ncbi:hypothetical protein ACFYVL_21015 [Streptomyces sp. NPDC004111]|uniref:hypothetical protein n=1 Tax=Streptomyces sp. NPDC004111 TaxID=3364690 RepID=UPI0036AF25D7
MTNWSHLTHAYGSAADIPARLDALASEPSSARWSDLWSALCHQGSVYPASFAALPWLAATAGSDDRKQSSNALCLAGAIVAGADQPHGAGDVRAEHAAVIAELLDLANANLRTATDRTDYLYLLEAVLHFEGTVDRAEDLAHGLVGEELELACPKCGTMLFLVLGERGCFSCAEDYALSDTDVESLPLRPAAPSELDATGRRLYELALGDDWPDIARALTYVFGAAGCPECDEGFAVATALAQR